MTRVLATRPLPAPAPPLPTPCWGPCCKGTVGALALEEAKGHRCRLLWHPNSTTRAPPLTTSSSQKQPHRCCTQHVSLGDTDIQIVTPGEPFSRLSLLRKCEVTESCFRSQVFGSLLRSATGEELGTR